ncbi:MAG TPA: hypothetical protein VMF50_02975 [Candidatus Binataceae bacterium]|nr:hypothetical protein [Candidatus Binataceae bacterium]
MIGAYVSRETSAEILLQATARRFVESANIVTTPEMVQQFRLFQNRVESTRYTAEAENIGAFSSL